MDPISNRPAPPKLHPLPKFIDAGPIAPTDIFIPNLIQPSDPAFVSLAFDPEIGVTGYRIHYGTNSLQYTEHKDLGLFTEGTANPLLPGRTYYFAATAYNDACLESDFSTEVSTTTRNTGSSGPPSTKPVIIYDVGVSKAISPEDCQPTFTFHFAFDAYINTAYQVQNKATSLSSTNAWKILETYYVHPPATNPDTNSPAKIACSYTFNAATNPPAQFFRVVKLP